VLAQLVRAVEELVGGRGGLFLLTGEAGIGKSAVVAAAAATAQARGARVLWGWGWPGEGTPAYWPWVRCFGRVAADGRRRAPAGTPRWPAPARYRGRPTSRRPATS
jgi:hypothetical protein